MDVLLEHIDCESNDSNDEAEHCESLYYLTSSTQSASASASAESNSSLSTSSHSGVSLLSVLKPPSPSEFSRKRKIAKNPLVGKKRANSNSQSNPKTIKPQQRIAEYSKEPFTVASRKLFCLGCQEELPLKKSSIEYHIKSSKHNDGKKSYKKGKLIILILHSP